MELELIITTPEALQKAIDIAKKHWRKKCQFQHTPLIKYVRCWGAVTGPLQS